MEKGYTLNVQPFSPNVNSLTKFLPDAILRFRPKQLLEDKGGPVGGEAMILPGTLPIPDRALMHRTVRHEHLEPPREANLGRIVYLIRREGQDLINVRVGNVTELSLLVGVVNLLWRDLKDFSQHGFFPH